jgi:hypothetical protein
MTKTYALAKTLDLVGKSAKLSARNIGLLVYAMSTRKASIIDFLSLVSETESSRFFFNSCRKETFAILSTD